MTGPALTLVLLVLLAGRDMAARRRVTGLPVVVVVAMAVVCVPASATTPLLSDNVDDPLMVGTSSHHCNWTRAMGPVCVYNTTSQVRLREGREDTTQVIEDFGSMKYRHQR